MVRSTSGYRAGRLITALVALGTVAASCSSGDVAITATDRVPISRVAPSTVDETTTTTAASTTGAPRPAVASTVPPATTASTIAEPRSAGSTTVPGSTVAPERTETTTAELVRNVVAALASDELEGRDNRSPGSSAARDLLIDSLASFAEPVAPTASGRDGFLQPFTEGTNVIGVVRGTDLADEFVMVGAHYDHLAVGGCERLDESDVICNGATDNATGVAAVMAIARVIADSAPRRSLLVALWDAEEDGLLGSRHFVDRPPVPIANITTYLNFDIQGATLTPGLADHTLVIGAESGGDVLTAAIDRATARSSLTTLRLSVSFGQGRSDHAPLAGAGVPVAFLTDGTDGCYHTSSDEVDAVDFDKLDEQVATAIAIVRDLLDGDRSPAFDDDTTGAAFDDAVAMLELLEAGAGDVAELPPGDADAITELAASMREIADAGPGAFDATAARTVAIAAGALFQLFDDGPCRTR